jgi:hypothetical protein
MGMIFGTNELIVLIYHNCIIKERLSGWYVHYLSIAYSDININIFYVMLVILKSVLLEKKHMDDRFN